MHDPLHSPALIDGHGRQVDYLRVSVTDRCDLRCGYCMPKGFKGFAEPKSWMSHGEMWRLVGSFARLGVSKIRLTGGEPLLRAGLCAMLPELRALPGIREVSLSTNATRLARHARELKAAGVSRLNVSLDTLQPERFARITGRDVLADVLQGLQLASELGFASIKLNMVVQAGVNEDEVEPMLDFACANGMVLRLIEPMPLGQPRLHHAGAAEVDVSALAREVAQRRGLLPELHTRFGAGPARYWRSPDGRTVLGAITPMSQHFCANCNRVRLTVEGQLYTCLGHEHRVPLGELLRAGASDTQLQDAIQQGLLAKPKQHEFKTAPWRVVRVMAQTGG